MRMPFRWGRVFDRLVSALGRGPDPTHGGVALAIPVIFAMVTTIGQVATLRPNDYAAAAQQSRHDRLLHGHVALWWAPGLLTPYLRQAHISSGPQGLHRLDAILIDPNYVRTSPNRWLGEYLFWANPASEHVKLTG